MCKKFTVKKSLSLLAVAVAVCVAFTACSAGSSGMARVNGTSLQHSDSVTSAAAVAPRDSYDMAAAEEAGTGTADSGSTDAARLQKLASGQKIIERLDYFIETLEFDQSVEKVQTMCGELGGYIQSSSVSGDGATYKNTSRYASFVLRIPQEKLTEFKNRAEEIGSVLNFGSDSENVTEQYYDTESRLKSLRAQEERLLELLKQSGTVADMVELEKALADVVYEIEQLTGSLRQYDSLISYSTINLQLQEVAKVTEVEKTPVTLTERISAQFRASLRGIEDFGGDFLVAVIGGLPIILLLAVLAVAVLLIVRSIRKRAKARAVQQQQKGQQNYFEVGPAPEKKGPEKKDPPEN